MTRALVQLEALPLVERLEPTPDPVEVFRRLAALPHVVFFDSAKRQTTLGRYSFIAADPVEWIEFPADRTDALAQFANRVNDCGLRIADCGLIQVNPQSEIRNPKSNNPSSVALFELLA